MLFGNRKDTVRVKIKPFLEECGAYMPFDLSIKLIEMQYSHIYAELPKELYDRIVSEKKKMDEFNQGLLRATSLNNKGIALEKKGETDKAISVYEQNIGEGYQTCHPYDRLVVLYRKKKDYDNEIRVIDLALKYLCNRYPNEAERFRNRKEKAIQLKNR